MPYKIVLQRKDGTKIWLPNIHEGATPKKQVEVKVTINSRPVKAIVETVRTFPSKSPVTAVKTVDQVDAREL